MRSKEVKKENERMYKQIRSHMKEGMIVNDYHLEVLEAEWWDKAKDNGDLQADIVMSLGLRHLHEVLQTIEIMRNCPYMAEVEIYASDLIKKRQDGEDDFYYFNIVKEEPACILVERVSIDTAERGTLVGHLTVEIQKILVSPDSSKRTEIAIRKDTLKERMDTVMQTLKELESEKGMVATTTLIKTLELKLKLTPKEIEPLIHQLRTEGRIYEPKQFFLKVT